MNHNQRGVSLIEMILAIFLFGLILSSILVVFSYTKQLSIQEQQLDQSKEIAQQMLRALQEQTKENQITVFGESIPLTKHTLTSKYSFITSDFNVSIDALPIQSSETITLGTKHYLMSTYFRKFRVCVWKIGSDQRRGIQLEQFVVAQ